MEHAFIYDIGEYCDSKNGSFAGDLSRRTDGISETRAFRSILTEFIRSSGPERISADKGLWMRIKKDGAFFPFHEKDPGKAYLLTGIEAALYGYFCYLKVIEFWQRWRNSVT